ncbi:MAG: hypothetical protein AB8B97_04545 [Granulosicoccus sp.]
MKFLILCDAIRHRASFPASFWLRPDQVASRGGRQCGAQTQEITWLMLLKSRLFIDDSIR